MTQMRFTAHTNFEKVYNALNRGYIERNEREIIQRQLNLLDSFDCRKLNLL